MQLLLASKILLAAVVTYMPFFILCFCSLRRCYFVVNFITDFISQAASTAEVPPPHRFYFILISFLVAILTIKFIVAIYFHLFHHRSYFQNFFHHRFHVTKLLFPLQISLDLRPISQILFHLPLSLQMSFHFFPSNISFHILLETKISFQFLLYLQIHSAGTSITDCISFALYNFRFDFGDYCHLHHRFLFQSLFAMQISFQL